MLKTATRIGPADNGRRMSLEEFDHAEVEEGYLYELGRGVINVSDVPKMRHARQVHVVRNDLIIFQEKHPERINCIASGAECKIMAPGYESERHPDLAIYLTAPPEDENDTWWLWIPDIVIEIVSASSARRDYHEKLEEYLAVGVREYWIIDSRKNQTVILRRAGDSWRKRIVRPPATYRTRLLDGFVLSVGKILQAAEKA